jgi:replication factor A1
MWLFIKRMAPSEEVIEARIAELRLEFGDLIDDERLRRIALMECGQKMAEIKKISDLKDREEITVDVTVTKIFDTRQFNKKDGSPGKVRNLKVKDDTGECRIALWDEDVDLVESLGIEDGSLLRCQDCFVKQTQFGVDITKGRKGQIVKL